MKTHPILDLAPEVRDSQRGKDFLSKMRKSIEEDDGARQMWSQKLDHYRRRRYAMEFRDPTYPWPGSSSIVLPLIDKKIDELKPQYVNLITATKPPVTCLAIDPDSQGKTRDVELWFEWLIKFGSPNFIEEFVLCVDDLLEQGFGLLKTIWHYETRDSPEFLRASKLPERLRKLIVTQKDNADEIFLAAGGRAPVITRKDFDSKELRPTIEKVVREEFDLDEDEPADEKAFSSIMSWLKSGAKDDLKFEHRDVVRNVPGIVAVRPQDLIVPENSPADVEGCERLTHAMFFSRVQIEQKARDGEWDEEAVKEILKAKKNRTSTGRRFSMTEVDEALREGVSAVEKEHYQIYETCCWYSRGEGKPSRKAVILWSPDSSEIPLKFYEYQRPSGKWPFHRAQFELNKNRWHSPRGIPEKVDDLEFEMTQQHRYKLNRATIATAPTFIFDPSSGINPSTWHWIPGQMMPARRPDLLRVLEMPQLDVVFEREEQILRTWVEEHIGGIDFGLSNPLSSLSEPRTATEINQISSKARQSLSLRGLLAQRMLNEVWNEMFDLQIAYGDDKMMIRTSGMQEPIQLTKEELQGKYVFQCTGTIGETDPQMEAQKSIALFQLLMQGKELVEPKYEIDLGAAFIDLLEKNDIRLSKKIVRQRTPQEIQMAMQKMQEQQAAMALMQAPPSGANGAAKPPPRPAPAPAPQRTGTSGAPR